MKVLQINSVCGIRSTGRICTDIADILKENGDECRVAYGRESVPELYNDIAVRIGNNVDVNCHALMSRVFDNTGHGSKNATKKFLKWVDDYNPDVIHLHNLHGYYINLELLFQYLKKVQKPVVWTLHDCWAFTGHCAHFDIVGCNKWKNEGCYNCPQKKRYPVSIFFDRSKKNFLEKKQLFLGLNDMTIVTPSQWLADLVKQSFLGIYPVKVIHNGIDLNVFKPTHSGDFREKYGLQDKKILLGVASSWSKTKGLYDFEKINQIKAEDEVVVLVGLKQEQLDTLPDGIIGITRTNNVQELAEIYTTADVFLNPTYVDSYPTVNLEAQACGTPVVTYKTGGSVESVLKDFIVPQGDVEALLSRGRECIESPRIVDNSMFSKSICYNQYVKLYRKIGS